MPSKKRHEGYLMIDHRASPGITAEFIRGCGKDPADFLIVGEGKMEESATITCSHCQRVVILSPTRTRAREYCPKCDHYLCDMCGKVRAQNGGECRTMVQIIEEVQEQAAINEQRGGSIILPTQ